MAWRNYNDPQYKAWRLKIKQRDGFRCQWPGCKETKRLHAHHIRRWNDNPILRFSESNGITLCKKHHDLIKNNEDAYIGLFLTIVAKKKK